MKNTINLFGSEGQHGTDLQRRGVFQGFDINPLGKNSKNIGEHPNIFVTPISETSTLIDHTIMAHPEQDIVNFSGIQSTTPQQLRAQSGVTNIHMMFGPLAENNLKAVLSGDISQTTQSIVKNCRSQGIRIIESDIETHDEMVSITQAFSHIIILLSGLSSHQELIQEWKTPTKTISDMITQNPQSIKGVHRLMRDVCIGDNITDIFMESVSTMTSKQLKDFSTPSFERVIQFCHKNTIHINDEMHTLIKNMLHTQTLFQAIDKIKLSQ